jgi:hypothetical protein
LSFGPILHVEALLYYTKSVAMVLLGLCRNGTTSMNFKFMLDCTAYDIHAFIDPNCGARFISTENILRRFNIFLHKFCHLRKTFIEKFNISENNIISVEVAKVVGYLGFGGSST